MHADVCTVRIDKLSLVTMGRKSVKEEVKWQVIGMRKCGLSFRVIASKLGISKTCVENTVNKHAMTTTVSDARRSGRPKVTSPREDRTISGIAKRNRRAAIPTIQREFQEKTGKSVSPMTCSRRLRSAGLHSYVAIRKPLLTSISRKNRRIWCRSKKNWRMERWGKVLFSDESRFQLFPNQRIRVRRTPTEKFLPECLSPAVQGGGDSVMIWGCMSQNGVGILRFISGSMDSKEYISTMKENMIPSAEKLHRRYFVYQQDNAPCHKSHATMQWFEDNEVQLLEWPSRSPDLNPIENLWQIIGTRVAAYRPANRHELREAISTIWNNISVQECQKLVQSMVKRVQLCLKAKGGPIDY